MRQVNWERNAVCGIRRHRDVGQRAGRLPGLGDQLRERHSRDLHDRAVAMVTDPATEAVLTVYCAWCGCVIEDGDDPEEASHGICLDCPTASLCSRPSFSPPSPEEGRLPPEPPFSLHPARRVACSCMSDK